MHGGQLTVYYLWVPMTVDTCAKHNIAWPVFIYHTNSAVRRTCTLLGHLESSQIPGAFTLLQEEKSEAGQPPLSVLELFQRRCVGKPLIARVECIIMDFPEHVNTILNWSGLNGSQYKLHMSVQLKPRDDITHGLVYTDCSSRNGPNCNHYKTSHISAAETKRWHHTQSCLYWMQFLKRTELQAP